ncbi:MAG: hypothetical protein IJX66_02005 [Lachnospiraceae bacterium]|nr:hypothetical protein [Lachnospiraceae bacterium]
MKKTMKKLLASLFAAALVVTGFSAPANTMTANAEGETMAYLTFADSSWSVQWWNDGNSYDPVVSNMAEVTGYGTYTVSLDFSAVEGGAPDITFMDVEISNGEAAFPNSYMTIDSIKINGEDVALAGTPYTSSDDGIATRCNLYNAWVADATTVENARTADGSADGITPCPVDNTLYTGINTVEVTFTLGDGVLCNASAGAGEAVLSEESYPAFIAIGADMAAENDWGFQYYGDGAGSNAGDVVATNGELKSGETTTLSLEFPSEVFYTWFTAPCMIVEDSSLISKDSTFDVKVFLDGEEVAVDMAAGDAFWAEGTGDYPVEQCVRIAGGYNEWGGKYLAESPKGFTTLTFEITPTIYLAAPAEEEAPQNEFDPNGTYHAYIGVQTPTWVFRNAWDDATYGKDSGCFDQLGFVDGEWIAQGGSFTDVEITGNGTYTVAVTGYDFSGTFQDQPILGADGLFNLLFVSTDLPVNDAVVISNVVLKMDGKEIVTQAEAFADPDSKEVQKFLLANIWNNEISALPYYAAPTNSIEISFDVSGFANDAVQAAPEATEAPAATETPAATEAPADAEGSNDGGDNTGIYVGIGVAAVAVIAIVAGVVVGKKKKASK